MTRPIISLMLLALLAGCQRADLDKADQRRRRMVVLAEMQARKAEFGLLVQQTPAMREEQARLEAALPGEAELPALFARLQDAAREQSVQLIEWKRENDKAFDDDLIEVGLQLQARGSLGGLVAWLEGVLAGKRVLVVDEIKIWDRRVEGEQILLTAWVHLAAYRMGDEPAPAGEARREIDKEFADDPEIRRLYEETKDLERIKAVVAGLHARIAKIEGILAKGHGAAALLSRLSRIESAGWFELIAISRGTFTIEGGAPQSGDVVQIMNLVQAMPGVRNLALMAEREATDPGTKRPYRIFTLSGELAPDKDR